MSAERVQEVEDKAVLERIRAKRVDSASRVEAQNLAEELERLAGSLRREPWNVAVECYGSDSCLDQAKLEQVVRGSIASMNSLQIANEKCEKLGV